MAAELPGLTITNPPEGGNSLANSRPEAEVGSPARTNKTVLHISSVPQIIHGGIKISAMIVSVGPNQFSFLPPPGWRVQFDPSEKRVKLVRSENGSLIEVSFAEKKATEETTASIEALRQTLSSRYPGAKIIEEFSISALGQPGVAFELEWRSGNSLRQFIRVAFVHFPGGGLEVSLAAPSDVFRQNFHAFNQLLLSFRHAPLDGKLEIQPVNPE
jgi:hypothetical protein